MGRTGQCSLFPISCGAFCGQTGYKIGCFLMDSSRTSGFQTELETSFIELGSRIPGNATLPEEMSQPEVACVGQSGAKEDHPWRAPGTAPVFGPCGSMGGMPLGCDSDGEGSFGDCCSNNCDSFALGGNAEAYQWPNMPVTEWIAGAQFSRKERLYLSFDLRFNI